MTLQRAGGVLVVAALALAACERVGAGYGGPTPAPSASPTPTAAACTTLPAANVIVGISPTFAVQNVAPYGQIAGYADVTAAQPAQSGAIAAKRGDTVQFENLDPDGVTAHSAVGFASSSFPPAPHAFPSAAASPSSNATIGSAFWSTGRIAGSTSGTACLSQPFTLPAAGTYYFGDLDFYNTITSFRDVIVVR